jgi:hypothetical protein
LHRLRGRARTRWHRHRAQGLSGKVSNQSVATLLGGGGVEYVMAYIGCTSLSFKAENKMIEEAQDCMSEDYRHSILSPHCRGSIGSPRSFIEVSPGSREYLGARLAR